MERKSIYHPTAEFLRETRRPTADHEVFMSFLLDEDAAYFEGWWRDEGNRQYAEWMQRVKDEADQF